MGYPSIDKPWLKFYSEDARNAIMPRRTIYQDIKDEMPVTQSGKIDYRQLEIRYFEVD